MFETALIFRFSFLFALFASACRSQLGFAFYYWALAHSALDGKTQTNFSLVNLSICCAVHTHILYSPHSLRIHVITLFLLIVIIIGRVFLPFLCFSHFRRWAVRRVRIAQTPNASLLFAVRINKNNNNNKTKLIL